MDRTPPIRSKTCSPIGKPIIRRAQDCDDRRGAGLGLHARHQRNLANATWFADSDLAPSAPPTGFNVSDPAAMARGDRFFARDSGADRDVIRHQPGHARPGRNLDTGPGAAPARLHEIGGRRYRSRGVHERTESAGGGAPEGYDTARYVRDFRIFHSLPKQDFPEVKVLGPGAIGKAAMASDLLVASAPSMRFPIITTGRCRSASRPAHGGRGAFRRLVRPHRRDREIHTALRDRLTPGKPVWLTETAEAACGGNRWGGKLPGYVPLSRSARPAGAGRHSGRDAQHAGGQRLWHAGREELRTPAELLGRAVVAAIDGNTVLDPGVPDQAGSLVYAHCQRGMPDGVSLLIINTDRERDAR